MGCWKKNIYNIDEINFNKFIGVLENERKINKYIFGIFQWLKEMKKKKGKFFFFCTVPGRATAQLSLRQAGHTGRRQGAGAGALGAGCLACWRAGRAGRAGRAARHGRPERWRARGRASGRAGVGGSDARGARQAHAGVNGAAGWAAWACSWARLGVLVHLTQFLSWFDSVFS